MRNTFRSPAFIKIKQNIQKSTDFKMLEVCKAMIEMATPILSGDEIIILQEYYINEWTRLAPIPYIKEDLSIQFKSI